MTREELYDAQIAELTTEPSLIFRHWEDCHGLFACRIGARKNGGNACLTEMRAYPKEMRQSPLVAQVIADERIPDDPDDITPEHLPAFLELNLLFDGAGIGVSRSYIENPTRVLWA